MSFKIGDRVRTTDQFKKRFSKEPYSVYNTMTRIGIVREIVGDIIILLLTTGNYIQINAFWLELYTKEIEAIEEL